MTELIAWPVNGLNSSAPTQRKQKSVLPGATGPVCFSEAGKIFAFSLNICGVKPADGDSSTSTMEECELCWQQRLLPSTPARMLPSFLTPQSEPDNSPKPGRKRCWVLCLELLCSVAKLRYWEVGRWKAVAVRDLEIFRPVWFLVCR